jgi:hypothetical protein
MTTLFLALSLSLSVAAGPRDGGWTGYLPLPYFNAGPYTQHGWDLVGFYTWDQSGEFSNVKMLANE